MRDLILLLIGELVPENIGKQQGPEGEIPEFACLLDRPLVDVAPSDKIRGLRIRKPEYMIFVVVRHFDPVKRQPGIIREQRRGYIEGACNPFKNGSRPFFR